MAEIVRGPVMVTGTVADYVGSSILRGLEQRSLARLSPFRVLLSLAVHRVSAVVSFRSPEQTIALRIEGGDLVHAACSRRSLDEMLLTEILELAVVGTQPVEEVVEHCEKTGTALARALHKRGLVAPPQLVRLLQGVLTHFVEDVLEIQEAEVVVGRDDEIGVCRAPNAVRLDLRLVLADHMRSALRKVYLRDLETVFAPVYGRWLQLDPDQEEQVEAIRLTKREKHPVEHTLTGEYQLEDVLRLSVSSRNETARLLVLLLVYGLLRIETEPPMIETASSLEATRKRLGPADHFTRLDAHWSTHHTGLTANHKRLLDRYHAVLQSTDPEAVHHAKAVIRMIGEAWEKVGDRTQRVAYRSGLVESEQRRHSAELILTQGRTAAFRSDWRLARECYDVAGELYPCKDLTEAIEELGGRA